MRNKHPKMISRKLWHQWWVTGIAHFGTLRSQKRSWVQTLLALCQWAWRGDASGLSDRVSALVFPKNKKKQNEEEVVKKKKKNASRNTHTPRKKQNKQNTKSKRQREAAEVCTLVLCCCRAPATAEVLQLVCSWELGKKHKKNIHNQRISASD